MSNKISYITNIKNFDPFGVFLRDSLKLTPLSLGLIVFILDLIVDGYIGLKYELLINKTTTPGLLQDYTAIIADFVYTPIICGLYLWSSAGSTRVFQQLVSSNIFRERKKIYQLIDKYMALYSKPLIFYLILSLSALFSFSQTAAYLGLLPWKAAGGWIDLKPAISFARAPFWMLMFYAFSFAAFNIGVTIIVLRKAFKLTGIQLLPLHPDRCGGLGSINQYSNKIALGIGAIGLLISAATVYESIHRNILESYPVIAGIIFYIILAPLFFFLPLGTAHDAMQNGKDKELLRLAKNYTKTYNHLKLSVNSDANEYDDDLKRLDNLKKLYQVADEFPVWPFDTHSLRRFLTVISTPLLPAIISITSELIKKWFRI